MNNFNKTFGIAFYNSFRKVKSNCDQENMSILHTHSFQKKNVVYLSTCSDLLIDKIGP